MLNKKPYQKPEIKEIKLIMEDTILAACKNAATDRNVNARRSGQACNRCNRTYGIS